MYTHTYHICIPLRATWECDGCLPSRGAPKAYSRALSCAPEPPGTTRSKRSSTLPPDRVRPTRWGSDPTLHCAKPL